MTADKNSSPDINQSLEEIARDNIHGATFLARRSLETLASGAVSYCDDEDASLFRKYLVGLAAQLAGAQPTMYAISNLLALVLDRLFSQAANTASRAELAEKLVKIVEDELTQIAGRIDTLGDKGAEMLTERFPEKARLVTISSSESVLAVLQRLPTSEFGITVAESRPMNEGVALAGKLAGMGFKVSLVTDAMLGIETMGASCALVGADTVNSDGAIVNKAGTRLLALAAKIDKVPLFCCAETFKIKPSLDLKPEPPTPSQQPRPPQEILKNPPGKINVRNLYFDRTEYFLVGGFFTELGFLRHQEIKALSDQFAKRHKKIFGEDSG